jgi:hypothetical protein
MLINKPIPSLIGGVSEQPANLRHPTQVESMTNCSPEISVGLSKRAGSDLVERLSTLDHSDSYCFGIDRGTSGTSERYIVVIANGSIQVFDWDGVAQTVTTPNGVGYLGASVPRTSFDHVTVADYTILTNKLVGVAEGTLASATVVPALYVMVRQGVIDMDYTITLNGTNYTYSIGNSAGVNQTDAIAAGLKALVDAIGTFTTTQTGNLLKIVKTDSSDFTWSVTDTYGDQCLFGFRDTVQRFEELPRKFVENVTIKIQGDPETPNDGWYVKWQKDDSYSDGVWVETRAHNIYTGFNAGTMPHTLVRNTDATWTFAEAAWVDRLVGDDESAPMPSFMEKSIQKVFFFRNRLGFLSDENIILSQVDDYFNFFPSSARIVADSDPIDKSAGSASAKVNFLRRCVPFDKSLFVTSDSQQFQFGGQDILSPKTAHLSPTTAYEIAACPPVAMGSNVLFPAKRGSYTSVREYYFDQNAAGNDALDVTAHVPTFIPGTPFQMVAAPALDRLFILTETIRTEASVYDSFWNGQEKVQSAWHRWSFAGSPEIVALIPFNTTLVALLQYPEGLFLVRVEMDRRQITDGALLWPVRLDRKFQSTLGNYNPAAAGYTTWDLPYNYTTSMQAVVLDKSGEIGQVLDLDAISSTTVGHAGNYAGCTVVIGEKYTASAILSEFFVRDREDKALLGGRLQLRDLLLNFADSGYFEVDVYPSGRDSFTYPYTGRVLGVLGITLGVRRMQDGEFRCPISAKSDEVSITISSDQAVPFSIQSGQFTGHYAQLSRRA